jgi:hypothetical protein
VRASFCVSNVGTIVSSSVGDGDGSCAPATNGITKEMRLSRAHSKRRTQNPEPLDSFIAKRPDN